MIHASKLLTDVNWLFFSVLFISYLALDKIVIRKHKIQNMSTEKPYISILRGINVSGKNIIKMDSLRQSYENLGLNNIITYLQSGNVIFTSENADHNELTQKIKQQIKIDFGFNIPVIVLSIDELSQVVANNPFLEESGKNEAFLHVTFLSAQPGYYEKKIIEDKIQNEEEIYFSDKAIYLYCPNGYGRTKLTNNLLENKLKVTATTRNWKTTTALLKIAKQ